MPPVLISAETIQIDSINAHWVRRHNHPEHEHHHRAHQDHPLRQDSTRDVDTDVSKDTAKFSTLVPEIQINSIPIDHREYLNWKPLGHRMTREARYRLVKDDRHPWILNGGLSAPMYPSYWSYGVKLRKMRMIGARNVGEKNTGETKTDETKTDETKTDGTKTDETKTGDMKEVKMVEKVSERKGKKKHKQSRRVRTWAWLFRVVTQG